MKRRLIAGVVLALLVAVGIASNASAAATGALPKLPSFKLRMEVKSGTRLAPGLTFIDPHQLTQDLIAGPEIVDDQGRVVWYHPLPQGVSASNFQVQTYEGEPVLTWWQGTTGNPAFGAVAPGIGQGEDVIMNSSYKIIAVIKTDDGIKPDSHEFQLTPDGKALVSGYNLVPGVNLTSVGGPANGTVVDSVVREIDVKTGKVLLDWSALAHVPITDSHALPVFGASPWDFFHVNSVSETPDGNLLISSRHMWALYEVNPQTGAIVSTIGGKESNYTFAPGAAFAWQHDPRFVGDDEISLFDNEEGVPYGHVLPYSRALWLHLDPVTHTVSVTREIRQPSDQIQTGSQGSVQTLGGGRALVGWGAVGTFAEYNRAGNILREGTLPEAGTTQLPNGMTVPNNWQTYRVFKERWKGTPAARPVLSVARKGGGWSVSAAWNGGTGIARWKVLAGTERSALTAVKVKSWKGLITTFGVKDPTARFMRVVAVAEDGRTLGTSKVLALGKG